MTQIAVREVPHFIGGKRVGGEAFDLVREPFSGADLYRVARGGEVELRLALDAALRAFSELRTWPAHKRVSALRRASALLAGQAEDFARVISREAGKPLKASRVEVARSIENLSFAADAAADMAGEGVPLDASTFGEGKLGFTIRAPRGVVAAISPFNFPLNLALHKVGPALAGGNSVILKPAPQTPLTAVMLAELLTEVGFPSGAVNVIHGGGDLGERLVSAPEVAVVSFTGSPQVGAAIKAASGLKPVVLELGNNSANLVDEFADVELAAKKLAQSGFAYQGQVCIHPQRLIVHDKVYDVFKEAFVRESQKLVVGDPLNERTDVGPLVNDAAAGRISEWVQEALDLGGTLVLGGEARGRLMLPTILEDVPPQAKVVREEVFGPVVVLSRAASWEAAIESANASKFGLQAGVFTQNLQNALRAARDLECGGVIVNDPSTFRVDNMPYGGVKDSGFGREGARASLEELTYLKTVVLG